MANTGFWASGIEGSVDNMNATLCQKGVEADFDVTKTGLTFWDTATSRFKRSNGVTWDALAGANTVHDAQGDSSSTGATDMPLAGICTQTVFAGGTETDLESVSITLAGSGAIEACGVFLARLVGGAAADGKYYRLYVDGVLVANLGIEDGSLNTNGKLCTLKGNRVASSGARIIKIALLLAGATPAEDMTIQHIDYVFAGVNKV